MQLLWLIILAACSKQSLTQPSMSTSKSTALLSSTWVGWLLWCVVSALPRKKRHFFICSQKREKTAQDSLWNDSMEGGGDSGKKDLLKNKIAGWNDGSAIKLLLRSQHQLPVSPVLGDRVPSSGLCGRLHTCSIHTDTQTKVNLETNKKRKLLLYLFSEQVQNCFGL